MTRDVEFGIGAETDPFWNPNAVELVCAANSVSLLMPYVEPYFARTARRTTDDVPTELRATVERFAAEEVRHQVEHRRFNEAVRARVAGIGRLESVMRWTYRRLESGRSRRFSVAFCAASETIAYALARWTSDHLQLFLGGAHPVSRMYVWHLAEEVEHKSVGYDVFEATDGSRWRYARAAVTTLSLLAVFVTAGTLLQLRAQRKLRNPLTWWRMAWWAVSAGMEITSTLAVSCLPGHHPSKLVDPSWYGLWLADLDTASPAPATGEGDRRQLVMERPR
jgi:predicted metal-dependent hydrolase